MIGCESWRWLVSAALGGLVAAAGCHKPDVKFIQQVQAGQYGQARADLIPRLDNNKGSRGYTADRMKLGVMDLADGLPDSAEPTLNEVYEILRTQGLNKDKTVEAVVINENVKRWKGEPFEQALMYCYIGIQKAMRGEWGNARAAVAGSVFMLKDFAENTNEKDRRGSGLTTMELATRACVAQVPEKNFGTATLIYNGDACVNVHEGPGGRRVTPSGRDAIDHVVGDEEFFLKLHSDYDVSLLRNRTVNGEKAFVIQATVRKDKPAAGNRIVFYFSQATGVLLRRVIYMCDGQVYNNTVFTDHQVNVEIPANRFDVDTK